MGNASGKADQEDAEILQVTVAGYDDCSSFQQASAQACGMSFSCPTKYKEPKIITFEDRHEFHEWLDKNKPEFGKPAQAHKTCPFVFIEPGKKYIGGLEEFQSFAAKQTTKTTTS